MASHWHWPRADFWRRLIALALFLAFAVFVLTHANAAEARSLHHHRHHRAHHHQRHAGHTNARTSAIAWREWSDAAPRSDVLADARRYLGMANPTGSHRPWCRDFVNMVLRQTGHALADVSGLAINALRLGPRVFDPQPGDLVVMRGHVTIFAGYGGKGVLGLGGNQGRGRVTLSSYPQSRVIAFVRPQ